MGNVLTYPHVHVGGWFVAQPDDNPAEMFDWYWISDVVVPSAQESMSFSVDAASAPMLQELTSGCGAIVAGRRLFDQTETATRSGVDVSCRDFVTARDRADGTRR